MHELAEEIVNDERITVLLYVGDYDPSGMFMSEEDLPGRLAKCGAPDHRNPYVRKGKRGRHVLSRVALTYEDVHSGKLPSFDAETKKTDPRYKGFIAQYGYRCWELDAMHPNELRQRIAQEVKRYVNPEDWQRHKEIEAAQRETTEKVARATIEAGAK